MYAINLADLLEVQGKSTMIGLLLADFLSRDPPTVIPNSDIDSGAVILDGPGAQNETKVTALVEFLQESLGPSKLGRRIRVYQQGQSGWKEIK